MNVKRPPAAGKFFAVVSDTRGWLLLNEFIPEFDWGHPFGNLYLFASWDDAVRQRDTVGGDARVAVVIVHD